MSCPRQSTSQGERKGVDFKDVEQEPQHQRPYGQFGRDNPSARYEEALLASLSEAQMKALVKVQALSRGKWMRRLNGLDSVRDSESSANEESQRWASEDLQTTESFSKGYVDKLKAELAAKSEDNKKLRASLSEQTSPATPHGRSKKDGKLSRIFQHFGRRSSSESNAENDVMARTRTF